MRLPFAAALLLGFSATAMAQCPVAEIEKALAAPLDGLQMSEQPVQDVQSTEGGVWRIYRAQNGSLHSVIRIDAGESGMSERRLSIHGTADYGIAVSRIDYLRHAFIEDGGPNGTVRRTTEYFYFCGGKLHVPPEQYATMNVVDYAKAGEGAQNAMLLDKDIADVTNGLKR